MINQQLCHNSICLDTELCSSDCRGRRVFCLFSGLHEYMEIWNIIKESISKVAS